MNRFGTHVARFWGSAKPSAARLSYRGSCFGQRSWAKRDSYCRAMSSTGVGASEEGQQPLQLPKGSWCSHMHVATSKYPLVPTAQYKPEHDHTLDDALSYYSKWNVGNMVFVQPSIYGTDNSCLLDALNEMNGKTPGSGRGVVEVDPATVSEETLRGWHDLGVRGIRINLVSVGKKFNSDDDLRDLLLAYAKKIRPLKSWALDIYMPMAMSDALLKIVPELDVKFAIAHCGNPALPQDSKGSVDSYSVVPGFKSMMALLESGSTWVKISGTYRLSKDPEMVVLEPLVRTLLDKAPDRVCWAGDWPHTRFENKIDLNRFVEKCFEWTAGHDEKERREKLFKCNTEELFDVR